MKILLIEDDLAECNEFEKSVQDFENTTICAMTNNATDALSLTKYHLPDVVILDLELHLGGGNGLEYLSDLKQLNLVHRPLVIVTTNNTSKIVLDTARDLGAAMILTKYEQDYSATYVLKTISLMQNTLKTSSTSDLNLSTLSPADREHHIRTYLHSQLNLLGVSPKYKGYDYLIDAILLLSQNPHALIGKELSDKYRTSANSIERAMQSAIKRTWLHADPLDLQKYYTAHISPQRGAPTLMEFILAFIFQLIVCLSLIPFIAWWRIYIRKSYYTYLKNMELQELQLKIQTLTADNDRLSQLVHKDNKLLTAMTHSVYTLLEQVPNLSPEKLESQCSLLCEDLLCLSQHRQSTLQELSGSLTGQFYTGHMIIDSVLNMMFQQAKDKDISLSVEIAPDFWANISSYLDEEELAHVIADLAQNAIIATQNAPVKHINFYFIISTNNIPSIQIADSGTPFPPVVLNALGQSRCSQHLHEGGSGIGLMDIWTLKSTTKATLLIEEFPSDANYTKCIHFIFDQKNRYLIMSPRYDSLITQISRCDVMIMSPQD